MATFSKAERKAREADAAREVMAKVNAERVAAGTCRHCGGPVPCWSEFGDQRVGVRHSTLSWKAARRRLGW